MSFQLRGFPRIQSLLQSRFHHRLKLPPHAVVRAGASLRALSAVAVTLACAQAGALLAQVPATPADTKPMAPAAAATTVVPTEAAPAQAKFELPSPWDASEPWRTDRFYFQFAFYTWHFHYDSDHQQSYLFDSEYHFKEMWLGGQVITGLALFQNSFGQFSQYMFGGLMWRPLEDNQPFYVKLTAGPLHGYTGQYQHKVPFNSSSGWAPAIIPSVGYCVEKRYCSEFVLLGANAALFTVGVTVP
jgi:hypothetical protein